MNDDVMGWLERAAAVLTALVAVATAVLAARQRPRLLREEEMWRQVLEASPDLEPARALHRHVSAQLMARHLKPGAPFVRTLLALGGLLAAGFGVLGVELGVALMAEAGWSHQHQLALLLAVVMLVGCLMVLLGGLGVLTSELDARNRGARQILGDPVDGSYPKTGHWIRVGPLFMLSASGVAIVAGVCAAFWGLGWTFAVGMPYPVVSIASVGVYLLGMGTWGVIWRRLVTRPPDPPPIPEPDELDCPVPVDSDADAGPPVGAGCPPRQQGVPTWRLVLGTALGTAAGHVLSRRRT